MNAPAPRGFTAHNVRLDDGSFTYPEAPPIDTHGNYVCVKNLLPLLYPDGWQGRSIVDLGCLEGGFATEFAARPIASGGAEAVRTNACAACAIARAGAASASAASVGARPLGTRANSAVPSAASSVSIRRRTVGWVSPSARAAPERLPLSSTARNTRW